MPVLDDLVSEVNKYPETHLKLEIVEVDVPGTELNVSEIGTFKIRVRNSGPLDVVKLTLKITGLNGTTVAQNVIGQPFVGSIQTTPLPMVRGHGGSVVTLGDPYRFKAPNTPRSAQDLVKVTVERWDGLLDHIFQDHSDQSENAQAIYRDNVLAS